MSEEYECKECGDAFDTKRGRSVHQTQAHDDKDEKEEKSTEKMPKVMLRGMPALAAVFILGLLTGLAVGNIALTELQGQQTQLNNGEKAAPGDTQGQDGEQNDPQDTTGEKDNNVDMSKISLEGEPMLGEKDAPVTMVLYEDFECPFCKRFENNAFNQIETEYVETGKVKVYWKDLPLPERIHPWADNGAEAMECVYREGGNDAFWKVKDRVFTNQDSISEDNVYEKIKGWASEEGVSSSDVQQCIDSGEAMNEVEQDKKGAASVGASGTPTSLVADKKLVGAQPFNRFKSVIDAELS